MPARSNFDANAIRRRLEAALVTGTLEALVETQNRLLKMVSKRGKGRFYAISPTGQSNMARVGGLSQFASTRIGMAGTAANRRALLKRPRGGAVRNLRDAGVHQASAPGDPPAPDTGNLRKTIQLAKPQRISKGNAIGWRIGIAAVYARALEYGYRRLAPRPYVAPVLAQMRTIGTRMIRNRLRLNGFRAR
jgi:hypothetical protein